MSLFAVLELTLRFRSRHRCEKDLSVGIIQTLRRLRPLALQSSSACAPCRLRGAETSLRANLANPDYGCGQPVWRLSLQSGGSERTAQFQPDGFPEERSSSCALA